MDASQQIQRFTEFFDSTYKEDLLERIRKGITHIEIDFNELSKFDPELSDDLLEQPDDTIKASEIALSQVESEAKNFRSRFFNLPPSQKIMIRNIRSDRLGKLVMIEGTVRQKSDVRPQVTTIKFECPACGNIINVIQLDKKIKEPSKCGCGRKGRFALLDRQFVDAQGIVLEESTKDMEGGEQPKRIQVFLKEDLVSPTTEKRTNPGSLLRISGVIKEVPVTARDGGQLTRFDLLFEANHIEPLEDDYFQTILTPEDINEIVELSKNPRIYDMLIQSLAPGIYGHDRIKEGIILQFLGGVQKKRKDGVKNRGDLHTLLIGDPGAGKSQLLKRSQVIAPKGRYVSGKGTSGAGLTAAVVKDEFLSGWSLEAGALVLANQGVCIIDELDKMSTDDTSAMHEALEQQTISISKANIQATLVCETTVLAAANPKFGRFDPFETLAKQIDLPPALISRFDLIFPVKDLPDVQKDEQLASFILDMHKENDTRDAEIDTDVLKKYITYARTHCNPKLGDEALSKIKDYYVKMRNSGSNEGGVKSIPITTRQLEALIRLSEASAKTRLSKTVDLIDAKRAIDLLQFCLSQFGVDPETGAIDIDRISSGITATDRSKIGVIKEIIAELENNIGKVIPIEDIIKEAQAKGISDSVVEETINKLKKSGDIFEPRNGFISRI